MDRLQGKIGQCREEDTRLRVPRGEGHPSARPKPRKHVAWALVAEQVPVRGDDQADEEQGDKADNQEEVDSRGGESREHQAATTKQTKRFRRRLIESESESD